MAGKGQTLQQTFLKYVFGAVTPATMSTTTLWVALHTADPGNSGDQTTNEVTYTNYGRVATGNSTATGGWVFSGTFSPCSVFPTSAIIFPICSTASAVVITNWSVGATSGTGGSSNMYYTGTVTPNISLGASVIPSLTTGTACTED